MAVCICQSTILHIQQLGMSFSQVHYSARILQTLQFTNWAFPVMSRVSGSLTQRLELQTPRN